MSKQEATQLFQALLLRYGALLAPRDPAWLDYSEQENVFTRHLAPEELTDV